MWIQNASTKKIIKLINAFNMPGSDKGINHCDFFFLKKNFDYLKYLRSISYTKTEVMLDALLAGQY